MNKAHRYIAFTLIVFVTLFSQGAAFAWDPHIQFDDMLDFVTASHALETRIGDYGFCAIVESVSYGAIGYALATIAVVILGYSAFLGRVNWGTAVLVVVGIATILGAPQMIDMVTGAFNTNDGCAEIIEERLGVSAGGGLGGSGSGSGSSGGCSSGGCN